MWSDPQENEDSAGFADPILDSAFAILAAVIVVLVLHLAHTLIVATGS